MKRRVVIVMFPGCEVLDFAGPLQAVHEAKALGVDYEIIQCGLKSETATAQGLSVSGLAPLPEPQDGDWIIVPGYPVLESEPPEEIFPWLRRASNAGATVSSVCTGAFLLGRAGLLEGRSCTTHWKRVGLLAERFPGARVLDERLFVEDGKIITSGGLASGIDMTLSMIERDAGPRMAAAVAREMVVYLRRDGHHGQGSVYLDFRTHLQPGVHAVQDRLSAHPENPGSVEELASLAGMSSRNLTRVFREATGISIHEFQTRVRLERAAELLNNPSLTVEAVASECGFSDARKLRRLWKSRRGTSPRESRS